MYFDAIIASDIVACPYADAFAALLNTLIHFSNINASLKVIISYKRRQASESKFWVALRKDFDVIEVDSGQYPGEFKDSDSMGIVIASRPYPQPRVKTLTTKITIIKKKINNINIINFYLLIAKNNNNKNLIIINLCWHKNIIRVASS